MKTQNKIIGVLLIVMSVNLSTVTSLKAVTIKSHFSTISKNKTIGYVLPDDPSLQIQVVTVNAESHLNISFNGNEGVTGTYSIYNSSNELVMELQIGLKQFPDFAVVNLSEFAIGTYTCNLTTTTAVHLSHFTIN